jgi:galactokinase
VSVIPSPDRLATLGFDVAEAGRKHHLAALVEAAFAELAGRPADGAWWVPGRLEVFGKHTDYCGGHSLIAAVPRGFILAAGPRADGEVRILDARRGDRLVIAPAGEQEHSETTSGWRRYARVAVRRLRRNFPAAALGADIVLASDLPSASGMSSSSALVVGLVNALVETAGLRRRAEWQQNIGTDADVAGYMACFENGLTFGTLAGDEGVGTHGGSEDHVAIVCGRARELSLWRFVPIAHAASTQLPDRWRFVIVSSGVAARKIGDARDTYNALSADARRLLELANRDTATPHRSLAAAIAAGAEPATMKTGLRARLDHFVGEDRRAVEALAAFEHADASRLGDLSAASQEDAGLLLRNQVPETIALVRLARQLGAFAASSFGAGFGGSVWALTGAGDAADFAARWLAAYQREFPGRTAAVAFVASPAPGLSRLA